MLDRVGSRVDAHQRVREPYWFAPWDRRIGAQDLGTGEAPDAEAAITAAIEEYDVIAIGSRACQRSRLRNEPPRRISGAANRSAPPTRLADRSR